MCVSEEFTGLDAPEPQHTATMSGTVSILQQFANGLKSRSEETRAKAAKDLQHYVTMELREVSAPNGIIHPCVPCECRGMGWCLGNGDFWNMETGLKEEMGVYLCPLACWRGEQAGDTNGWSSTRISKLAAYRSQIRETILSL